MLLADLARISYPGCFMVHLPEQFSATTGVVRTARIHEDYQTSPIGFSIFARLRPARNPGAWVSEVSWSSHGPKRPLAGSQRHLRSGSGTCGRFFSMSVGRPPKRICSPRSGEWAFTRYSDRANSRDREPGTAFAGCGELLGIRVGGPRTT